MTGLVLLVGSISFNARAPPLRHASATTGAYALCVRHALPRASSAPSPLEELQARFELFSEGKRAGGFKQGVAEAIAGKFDRDAVAAEVQTLAASAPLVLFTWEASPSCKKALKLLAIARATPKIVRLDDPWDEGNKKRAALGRLTGKSSVPSIWIGGKYIGGCEDGPSPEAPGLVPMAFAGTLLPALEAAGALQQKPSLSSS
ncbi:hypothetical protein AB1Y20_020145 [Prymnesium parvum]|uniref:Glutaredoxin domain-containing protein n=1 Tax=Prymnesium parvum TaxID=97485 RepID=A0AB34JWJ9_PRYPA